jgi:HSP20 family protein
MVDLWSVVNDVMKSDAWFAPFSTSSVAFGSPLRADVDETDSAFVITAELPGVTLEDVTLELEDDVLILSAVKRPSESAPRGHHHAERRYGTFKRSFALPKAVDRDGVQATMRDGVLTINLPKSARATARQIPIRVGAGNAGENEPLQITGQSTEQHEHHS